MRPRPKLFLAFLLLLALLAVSFEVGSNQAGHHHAAANERFITVHMRQTRFQPQEVTVRVGETVHFLIENHDPVLHDLTTDSVDFTILASGGAEHAGHGAVESNAGASKPGPLHVAADGKKRAQLVFEASKSGRYEFYCTVPGHKQAGMVGLLLVEG